MYDEQNNFKDEQERIVELVKEIKTERLERAQERLVQSKELKQAIKDAYESNASSTVAQIIRENMDREDGVLP